MTDADQTHSPRNPDDVVDLRAYAVVLAAWWREIVVGAVSFAVGTAALVLAARVVFPTYETQVDVTVIRMATQVSMDQTLQTGGQARNLQRQEWAARRAALVGLVHNADVAQAVAERLRGQFEDEKDGTANRLIRRIDADLVTIGMLSNSNMSDLIRITARGDSPEQAVAVANAWAEEYVNHVNRLYEQVPETLTVSISTAVANAQQAYDDAQTGLEAFVARSEIDRLQRQIAAKATTLGNLQDLWRVTVDTQLMAVEKQQETAFQTVNEWFDSQFQELATNYDTRRKINLLLADARGLRAQVESGGEASVASNGLAFLLLKTAAYASSVGSATSLELNVADGGAVHVDARQQLEDVNAIIGALEDREQQLARDIARQSQTLSNASLPAEEIRDAGFVVAAASNGQGLGDETAASNGQGLGGEARGVAAQRASISGVNQPLPVQAVSWAPSHLESLADYIEDEQGAVVSLILAEEEELRALKAEREQVLSEQRALQQERDLRWSALNSLQNERIELEMSSVGNVSEVRLASRAAVPEDPVGLAVWLLALLAGFVGLLAMVCLTVFADATGGRPWLHEWRAEQGAAAR